MVLKLWPSSTLVFKTVMNNQTQDKYRALSKTTFPLVLYSTRKQKRQGLGKGTTKANVCEWGKDQGQIQTDQNWAVQRSHEPRPQDSILPP